MSQLINEAFKELKGIDLDEELFSFNERGAQDLAHFLDSASDPVLDIIDPLATDEEELQPTYEGNVICQCCVCKQLIYKKPEDIIIDAETQNVNVGEECPHCYNTIGFKVIGQVEPYFDKNEVKVTVDDNEVAVEEDEVSEPFNESWEDAYKQFTYIVDKNIKNTDQIEKQVDALYTKHKGEKDWDFAYRRWMEGSDELAEDTVKQGGKWVNKGKEGTHGTFRTRKAADAQRKAMYASGYKGESLKERLNPEDATIIILEIHSQEMDDFLYTSEDKANAHFDSLSKNKGLLGYAYLRREGDDKFYRVDWKANKDYTSKVDKDIQKYLDKVNGAEKESLKEDLDPSIVAKMDKDSFINYVTTRKGWTAEEVEDYLKTYFNESFEDEYAEVTDIILEIYPHETRDFLYTNDDQARSHFGKLRETQGRDKKDTLWGYAYLRRQPNKKFRLIAVEATEDMYETDVKEVANEYLENMNNYYEPLNEASDEKIKIKVTEEDINYFDEDTGDIIIDKAKFVGKDIQKGDYITLKFVDENEDADTQDYMFVEETKDGFKLEWIGTKGLHEDFQKATVETGSSILSMESDDSGKVTVTSEPRKAEEGGDETIAPISDEVMAEIEDNNTEGDEEEEETEETVESENESDSESEETSEEAEATEDVEVDEFEESYFNELGKKYLQEVYNNVTSYKTTKGFIDGNKIKLEGIISFNSGKKAKTTFFFEGHSITKSGKIKFFGENAQITSKKNAFTLTGKVNKGKLFVESLTYNYRAKDAATGKTVKEYGTVKR